MNNKNSCSDNNNDDSNMKQKVENLLKYFEENMIRKPYPMYPNYGAVTRYEDVPISVPEQHQFRQPGLEELMIPRPIVENRSDKGSGKLLDKVALITGGDSGIGAAADTTKKMTQSGPKKGLKNWAVNAFCFREI